ncbi:hypothetical protein PR003_g28311 [Phytophthora rubi]|uniref:Uncharacterized protein n=1 Tax=Phytophthora rubi TaxID=129364 RepID=A0A6A4BV69_9STRA|nr:hypothetical protein PR003_g28311 [Phytophthora rubi]
MPIITKAATTAPTILYDLGIFRDPVFTDDFTGVPSAFVGGTNNSI